MNNSGIQPVEFKVLVRPKKVEEKTIGGIIIPESAKEKEKYATVHGELVAVSALAFTSPDWLYKPKVGDTVMYDKYSGARVKGKDDEEYILLNDKEIGAVIYG